MIIICFNSSASKCWKHRSVLYIVAELQEIWTGPLQETELLWWKRGYKTRESIFHPDRNSKRKSEKKNKRNWRENAMDPICAETWSFNISFPLSAVSHRVPVWKWDGVLWHMCLLPIPRAESEIDVVFTQLCPLDGVCAGVFLQVSGC